MFAPGRFDASPHGDVSARVLFATPIANAAAISGLKGLADFLALALPHAPQLRPCAARLCYLSCRIADTPSFAHTLRKLRHVPALWGLHQECCVTIQRVAGQIARSSGTPADHITLAADSRPAVTLGARGRRLSVDTQRVGLQGDRAADVGNDL